MMVSNTIIRLKGVEDFVLAGLLDHLKADSKLSFSDLFSAYNISYYIKKLIHSSNKFKSDTFDDFEVCLQQMLFW